MISWRIFIEDIKDRLGLSKKKYPKIPKLDTIYRPFKSWAQKDGRWNLWHDTFKRGIFYTVLRTGKKLIRKGAAWPLLKIVKRFFKRHDTWPTDGNIPKTEWNHQFWILRKSYENAFDAWFKAYYYQGYKAKNPDEKKFRKSVYNSWTHRCIRWMIDFICLAGLEDTIYRELLAVWSFEHQKLMNKVFNPEIDLYHVFYCSYYDGDPRYFNITKKIAEQRKKADMSAKPQRMSPEHQIISDKVQEKYEKESKEYLKKQEQEKKKKKKLIETDIDMKGKKDWKEIGEQMPDLIQKKVKGHKAIMKQIPKMKKGDIVILSIPNAPQQSMLKLEALIAKKHPGKGDVILINKPYDLMVFRDLKNMILQKKV